MLSSTINFTSKRWLFAESNGKSKGFGLMCDKGTCCRFRELSIYSFQLNYKNRLFSLGARGTGKNEVSLEDKIKIVKHFGHLIDTISLSTLTATTNFNEYLKKQKMLGDFFNKTKPDFCEKLFSNLESLELYCCKIEDDTLCYYLNKCSALKQLK